MRKVINQAKRLARKNDCEYVVICEGSSWFTVSYLWWLGSTYGVYSYRITPAGLSYRD